MDQHQRILNFLFVNHPHVFSSGELVACEAGPFMPIGPLWAEDRRAFRLVQQMANDDEIVYTLQMGFMLTTSQWLKMVRVKQEANT